MILEGVATPHKPRASGWDMFVFMKIGQLCISKQNIYTFFIIKNQYISEIPQNNYSSVLLWSINTVL